MAKDTVLQSFENLLNYADAEHSSDHVDGFCQDEKKDCVTCNWLVDAHKNHGLLLQAFTEKE